MTKDFSPATMKVRSKWHVFQALKKKQPSSTNSITSENILGGCGG